MTYKEVFQKVVTILVKQLGAEASKISPETDIVKDLGADSLDTVEIIMEIEEVFDILIPDVDAKEQLWTVRNIVEYVLKQKGGSGGGEGGPVGAKL